MVRMDEKPKHRLWYQFRLTTVLILTAILAWGMACRPFLAREDYPRVETVFGDPNQPGWWVAIGTGSDDPDAGGALVLRFGPMPALAYPLLVLALFLAWKAACAVVERRRRSLPATWRETHSHSPRSGGRA